MTLHMGVSLGQVHAKCSTERLIYLYLDKQAALATFQEMFSTLVLEGLVCKALGGNPTLLRTTHPDPT